MFKYILILIAVLWSGAASAQNVMCANRTVGDSTNACANTRFVGSSILGLAYYATPAALVAAPPAVGSYPSVAETVSGNHCPLTYKVNSSSTGTYGELSLPGGTFATPIYSESPVQMCQFKPDHTGVADSSAACTAAVAFAYSGSNMGTEVISQSGATYNFTLGGGGCVLPANTQGAITLKLNGTYLKTSAAIPIISRFPANQTAAGSMVNGRVIIEGGDFNCNSTTGSYGIRIGASYGSEIRNSHVQACDWGIHIAFGLMTRVVNVRTTLNKSYGVAFTSGSGLWTGGGLTNSASNGSVCEQCRDYASAGQLGQFYYSATEGFLRDSITEGGNPVNSVIFDTLNSTVIKSFVIDGLHSENVPSNSVIIMKSGGAGTGTGTFVFRNILLYGLAPTFLDTLDYGNADYAISDIPWTAYLGAGLAFKIPAGSGGVFGANWTFHNWGAGNKITDTTWWSPGVVPINLIDLDREPAGNGSALIGRNLIIGNITSAAAGSLSIAAKVSAILTQYTTIATAAPFSLTASQMGGTGISTINLTAAGAGTVTTDTATNIINASYTLGYIGQTFRMRIMNGGGGLVTLAAGTGVTLSGTATIANGAFRDFDVAYTGAGAVTITNVGAGTI